MQDKDLFKTYTITEFLDELETIECFNRPGRRTRFSEVTKKQRELFKAMEVTLPASLCCPGNPGFKVIVAKTSSQ